MNKKLLFITVVFCCGLLFLFSNNIKSARFNASFKKKQGALSYDLSNPLEIHELPKILNEVSGVTDISNNQVGCVQDEKGIVFIYNIKTKKIVKKIHFGRNADYEGITYAEDKFYVMRSNGIIHEINLPWNKPVVRINTLKLPTWNNEGLCYDKGMKKLLIAPKSKLEETKSIPIFSYDVGREELDREPLFNIFTKDILNFAKKNKLPIPRKKKGKKGIKFKPSSIAVHPKTNQIYVLSAKGNLIVVFDKKGNIKGYEKLDKTTFNQPEGLTFLKNGDMIITNEGNKKKPTLLVFPWYKD